jgi:hypothetical protein
MVNTCVPIIVLLNMAALSEKNPVFAKTFRDIWYAHIWDKVHSELVQMIK